MPLRVAMSCLTDRDYPLTLTLSPWEREFGCGLLTAVGFPPRPMPLKQLPQHLLFLFGERASIIRGHRRDLRDMPVAVAHELLELQL